jgi:hypothetical protein
VIIRDAIARESQLKKWVPSEEGRSDWSIQPALGGSWQRRVTRDINQEISRLRSARNDKNARLEWKRVLRPQETDEHDNPDLHA